MFENALIIAGTEGFIVKGVVTKLKGIGVDARYSPPRIKELEGKLDNASLYILFTDEDTRYYSEALSMLKDHCAQKDKRMIVIGTKVEFETLLKNIPSTYIFSFFERPFEMDMLLNGVEKFYDEDQKISRRKSILIVDDDVSYMSIIVEWIKDKYRISMVTTGTQAITWLAKNHADLILLDYEMPVTSGPQVLEMIRSDKELADIPVMFLTGRGDKESIMNVLELKPDGYLLKSIDKNGLHENIANFFSSQAAKTEQPATEE